MNKRMIASVAVDKTAYHFDKLFDYLIPDRLTEEIQVGCRVLIPFGKGNKKVQGMVFAISAYQETAGELKPIHALLDPEPVFTPEMFRIAEFLVKNTFCTYYDAIRAILPVGLNLRINPIYRLTAAIDNRQFDCFSQEEKNIINFLRNAQSPNQLDSFLEEQSDQQKKQMIRHLLDEGIIEEVAQVKRKVQDETIRMVRLLPEYESRCARLSEKQKSVIELLNEVQVGSVKEVCYLCGMTEAVLKTLAKKGIIEYFEREVYRTPIHSDAPAISPDEIVLSEEQEAAFDGIRNLMNEDQPNAALLYGVTGSGKTQIFIKLIEETLRAGKQAILLVPEISLTPQTVAKFRGLFSTQIAVMHSSLSLGERLDEWKRIKRGEANIVIGTRSAVFAPLDKIGIIIMDEEGENSYKSESAPRYHAREIAKLRCVEHQALLLMASATPSIDTFYHAKSGRYHYFELKNRYTDAGMPDIYLLDLKEDEKRQNHTGLSSRLIEELYLNLQQKEQSILLLNRRGYNSFATCLDCSNVISCPHCSVALTYHKANGYLMCHYCGHAEKFEQKCPECGGNHIKLSGLGTQRIEDELATLFPDARILRMDTDTTYSRYAYEENFAKFAAGEYDIMIGTQMIAKGLNFPNVTLVGVLSVDQSLYANDYRSCERTFSLVTQVVGRSGRGEKKGRAFIQTYTPDHPVINYASEQNFHGFYQDEIQSRKALLYPPFCDLCVIGFSGAVSENVKFAADYFMEVLKAYLEKVPLPIRVLGPVPAGIFRVNGKYRYRIILKCKANAKFKALLSRVMKTAGKHKSFSKISFYADINGDIL